MIGLIPLWSRGRVVAWAQVDAADVEAVSAHHWYRDSLGYPASGKHSRLHRFLVEVPDGYVVDHINRDKLDNRLSNLRIVTQQVNTQNTPGLVTGSSVYRGVYRDHRKSARPWYVQVKHEGVKHYGGVFASEEEAAEAAERLRLEAFGPPVELPVVRRVHVPPQHRAVKVSPEKPPRVPPPPITECVNGHPYDDLNTYRRPAGTRDCRACIRERARRYQQRRREAA